MEYYNYNNSFDVKNKVIDNLIETLLKLFNYKELKPIQKKLLCNINENNIIINSMQGTGKTFAFIIKLLFNIDFNASSFETTQALIVVSTKELAYQIYSDYLIKLENICIYSKLIIGLKISNNEEKIFNKCKPHIIIGTVGKLHHFFNYKLKKKKIPLNIKYIVYDECDKLLGQDKQNYFTNLIKHIGNVNTITLVSTTCDKNSIDYYLNIYKNIEKNNLEFKSINLCDNVDNRDRFNSINEYNKIINLNNINIYQLYISFTIQKNKTLFESKLDLLYNIVSLKEYYKKVLIFYNNKINGEQIVCELRDTNIKAYHLHSDIEIEKRKKIYIEFKSNSTSNCILLTTDLFSRGIDVECIDLVINFDMPYSYKDYIHRIGRTGRNTKKGVSIIFNDKPIISDDNLHDFFFKIKDNNNINTELITKDNSINSIIKVQSLSDIFFYIFKSYEYNLDSKHYKEYDCLFYKDILKSKDNIENQNFIDHNEFLNKKRRNNQYNSLSLVGNWVDIHDKTITELKLKDDIYIIKKPKIDYTFNTISDVNKNNNCKFCLYCDLLKYILK